MISTAHRPGLTFGLTVWYRSMYFKYEPRKFRIASINYLIHLEKYSLDTLDTYHGMPYIMSRRIKCCHILDFSKMKNWPWIQRLIYSKRHISTQYKWCLLIAGLWLFQIVFCVFVCLTDCLSYFDTNSAISREQHLWTGVKLKINLTRMVLTQWEWRVKTASRTYLRLVSFI